MSELNTNNGQSTPKTRQDIEAHIIATAWKDEDYKQKLIDNPKLVIEQEFGLQLSAEMNVRVLEENSTNLYLVLPMRPSLEDAELSEEQLEAVAGGSTPLCGLVSVSAAVSYVTGKI